MPFQRLNLDIDLLRSFVAIAETENFTRAAERVGRQQSTISLQIKRLEHLIDGQLLVRSPHSVSLTASGRNFLPEARRLIDLNDAIVARARAPELHGVVRLGTPEDFATRHLPKVLERFAQVYPGIALEVTCDLTLNLLQRFRLGAFDLALIKREQTIEADGIRVWHEPLVWVGGFVNRRALACTFAAGGVTRALRLPPSRLRLARRSGDWLADRLCLRLAGRLAGSGQSPVGICRLAKRHGA